MPTHTAKFLLERGPLIEVEVDIPPILKALMPEIPSPHRCQALLDTGASGTGIQESILTNLGLVGSPGALLYTPKGPALTRMYACSLSFPGTGLAPVPIVQALGVNMAGFHPSVLIGWDILKNWTFVCDGPSRSYFINQHF